jgi:hypothetical protein
MAATILEDPGKLQQLAIDVERMLLSGLDLLVKQLDREGYDSSLLTVHTVREFCAERAKNIAQALADRVCS